MTLGFLEKNMLTLQPQSDTVSARARNVLSSPPIEIAYNLQYQSETVSVNSVCVCVCVCV